MQPHGHDATGITMQQGAVHETQCACPQRVARTLTGHSHGRSHRGNSARAVVLHCTTGPCLAVYRPCATGCLSTGASSSCSKTLRTQNNICSAICSATIVVARASSKILSMQSGPQASAGCQVQPVYANQNNSTHAWLGGVCPGEPLQ